MSFEYRDEKGNYTNRQQFLPFTQCFLPHSFSGSSNPLQTNLELTNVNYTAFENIVGKVQNAVNMRFSSFFCKVFNQFSLRTSLIILASKYLSLFNALNFGHV